MACEPSVPPSGPEIGVSGLALSLSGIAEISAEKVLNECVINSTNVNPVQNSKGSINTGGGGGGGGSGCGKQAPCGGSETKSKSCGGGGGGCGGKKKKSCSPQPLKVVFKDINGVSISTGNVQQDTQKVEKQSSANAPWTSQEDILPQYDLTSQGKKFDKWSTDEWRNVEKDLEVSAVYRNLITDKEESTNNTLIQDKISQEDADKVQNFSDTFLNDKAGQPRSRFKRTVVNYFPRVPEYGKYNAAINKCVTYVDTVTNNINNVFNILVNHTDECTDWDTFNDLKKCLLNIQSTFIFQTRMVLNLDLQDILEKINFYTAEMMEKARKAENIDQDLKEHYDEINLDLEFFNDDTVHRYEEFKNSFNSYVDTINKCFPVNYIEKL